MLTRFSLLIPAIALGALLALGQPAVHAQRPGGPPRNSAQMADRVAQTLNLTPTQKARMASIIKAQQTKMMAVQADTKTPQPQKIAKMRAIMQASIATFSAILTPAQRQKLAAMRLQRRGPGGPGRPATPR